MSKQSSTPYYILPGGQPNYEIPGSAALKTVGGKVVVGKYHVSHRNQPGERFPWVVSEKENTDAVPLEVDYREVETFPQYRFALRAAKKLDRQHLAALTAKPEAQAA